MFEDNDLLDISKSCQSNYFCVFERFPNLVYYIQRFSLPGTNHKPVNVMMPHTMDYSISGVSSDQDDLTMDVITDEKYITYFSILSWLRENQKVVNIQDTVSDMSLIILNNAKIPIIRVNFKDVLPMSLAAVEFNIQSVEPAIFNATFKSYEYSWTYLDGTKIRSSYDD